MQEHFAMLPELLHCHVLDICTQKFGHRRKPMIMLCLPHMALGECLTASEHLASELRRLGIKAWVPRTHSARGESENTPEVIGYTDRLNMGYPSHYWTCVEWENKIYSIDLTASQYGYSGPQVRICPTSSPEVWAQDKVWCMQLPPALTETDINENRRARGIVDTDRMTFIWDLTERLYGHHYFAPDYDDFVSEQQWKERIA